MLRGSGLQIVEFEGRVRASIGIVEPRDANSADQSETVLLRLITEKGRPSRSPASEPSSGLSFAGPTGTQSTYVVLKADGNATSLKLRDRTAASRW